MLVRVCLAAVILLVTSTTLASERGVVVDQIIAVVNGEPITQSELTQETRIALAQRKGEQAALVALEEQVLVAFRDYVVNQRMVSVHVRRLGSLELARKIVDEALKKFKSKFRSPSSYQAFCRRFDIRESTIRAILRRDLRNELFIRDRLRSRKLGKRFSDTVDTWSKQALTHLLAEMKETVEIRFLDADEQLERQ